MTRVIVDEILQAKLGNLGESLELCDDAGNVLGYFTPAPQRSIYDGVDSPTSVDELRRRELEGGGRPLSEILTDLQTREIAK